MATVVIFLQRLTPIFMHVMMMFGSEKRPGKVDEEKAYSRLLEKKGEGNGMGKLVEDGEIFVSGRCQVLINCHKLNLLASSASPVLINDTIATTML